jgi:5-methylcytosine-specific restriction endonuclease McrA
MSLSGAIREQVRQRAQCACEFCGVTEIDTGGMLTIDHFRPRAKAGSDELENLIYACITCNQKQHNIRKFLDITSNRDIIWKLGTSIDSSSVSQGKLRLFVYDDYG